jgi:DNA-binding NtrC family response regulator
VDDEWLLRWALVQRLGVAGYRVVEAGDAAEALRQFDASSPPVDVVLLDLKLPDADGMSVLSHVKAHRPTCPVILMSAHGNAESEHAALDAGAFRYLSKPFDHSRLLALVRDAIRN